MSVFLKEHHIRIAEEVVKKAHANNGLAPVDIERFWADQQKASADIWAKDCPQLPLGFQNMSDECVFAELGLEEDWVMYHHNPVKLLSLVKKYNDKSEKIVGRRLLNESEPTPADRKWPQIKQLNDIFESENVFEKTSYWLKQSANSEPELSALLDRVEKRLENLKSFMLPPNWAEEKERLMKLGLQVPLYRGQRGPVTFAMSIYGVENLIFLLVDNEKLAARFSKLIERAILERARVLDEESGLAPDKLPHGWFWCDDNCCNLNVEMYRFFAYPIIKSVFAKYSPDPGDNRYQHSDSDMAHHLPALQELGIKVCNFGPKISIDQIREHMPNTEIHGQLAPFTFSRNEEVNLVAECIRDFEMSKEKKGVRFSTAGSINNGSRLTGMRLVMSAIQTYCRY